MEFDVSRVYTAVNADELKIGNRIIVADNLMYLKSFVEDNRKANTLMDILNDSTLYRFQVIGDNTHYANDYALAYLVSEPEEKKLRWTDLEVGDVIHKGSFKSMVIAINKHHDTGFHVLTCDSYLSKLNWLGDDDLKEWEKVEK